MAAPGGADSRLRYLETLHNVPKAMAELMSSYSGIPKDEQIAHITKLRNEAYAQFPYPCMGTFRFLDLDSTRHGAYKEHVLAPLCQPAVPGKPEPLYLDCGCCLGQDVRKLVVDGAPPNRLWASDIEPRFIELGFELFRDADKLPQDHFLCPGNMLIDTDDASKDQLVLLNDKVTILHISAVFHLFDLEDQRRVAHRCLQLLRKDTGGPVLIFGGQVGGRTTARLEHRAGGVPPRYRYQHSPESWEAFWRDVCGGSPWKENVAALEVKSRLFGRVRNEDRTADETVTLCDPDETSDTRLWQMFEVWVTFKAA